MEQPPPTFSEVAGREWGKSPMAADPRVTEALRPRRLCDLPEPHAISIKFEVGEFPRVEFTCSAPVGAGCRSVPACMTGEGRCVDREGSHHPDCDPAKDRDLVDAGECNVKNWIDLDPQIQGEGSVSLPVTTEWTGEDWVYQLVTP